MSEFPPPNRVTTEEIGAITRQTNYGTWRFQTTLKPLYNAEGGVLLFSA